MISALPTPTAPADSTGGSPPAQGESAAAPAPFDFILALETLAAQAADPEALAAGTALLEGAGLPGEDESSDPADEDPDEDALEFLAGLLNMEATRAHAPDVRTSANASSATGSRVDGLAGNGNGNGGGAVLLAGLLEQGAQGESETAADPNVLAGSRAHELPAAPPRTPGIEQSTVTTHARDPRWADEFGARVSLLLRAGESRAALQLTPVDLGPVDVNVTVRDSQATIHFGAANAETRALIEASLPKLREMLAAQGFNLLDASVSQGFTQKDQPQSAGVPRPGLEPIGESQAMTVRHLNGLLDLYA
jgi:flagellar hook-length control protein FliK